MLCGVNQPLSDGLVFIFGKSMTSATESISGGRGEEKENLPRTKLKKQKRDLEAKEAKEAKEIDKTCLAEKQLDNLSYSVLP